MIIYYSRVEKRAFLLCQAGRKEAPAFLKCSTSPKKFTSNDAINRFIGITTKVKQLISSVWLHWLNLYSMQTYSRTQSSHMQSGIRAGLRVGDLCDNEGLGVNTHSWAPLDHRCWVECHGSEDWSSQLYFNSLVCSACLKTVGHSK